MAKIFTFNADDSLIVQDGGATGEAWSMTPEQAAKHDRDAAWRAAMTAPQRTKIDAIKVAEAAKLAASGGK